jgi:hypothetical protein
MKISIAGRVVFKSVWIVAVLLVGGCTVSATKPAKGSDDDMQVRQAFTALQVAIKARDGAKIYELLDADKRQDADRIARDIKETFIKADDKKKEELAGRVGLTAAKLADLSGRSFLESELFFRYDEHDELPDVKKLDKVEIKGDTAKVEFKDPDKPEKDMALRLVREDGTWRFQVGMPRSPE